MSVVNNWNSVLTISKLVRHIYNQDIHCIDETQVNNSRTHNNSIVFHDDQFNSRITLTYNFTKPLRKECVYSDYDSDEERLIDDIIEDNRENYSHLKRIINNNRDKPDNKIILYHYNATQFMSKMLTTHTANRVDKHEPYFVSDNNSMINLNEDEIGILIHTNIRMKNNTTSSIIDYNDSNAIKHFYQHLDDDKHDGNKKGIIHLSTGVDKTQRYLIATVKINNLNDMIKFAKLYGLQINGYLLYTFNFEKLIMNHYQQHNFLQLFNFFPQLDMFIRLSRIN